MYKHQECLEKIRGLWNKESVRNNCIKINYTYHKRWKLHKTDRQANIWRKRAQACDLMDMDKQEFKQDVLWKMKVKSKETGQQVGPVLRVQIHIRHSERWMSKCLSVVSNFLLQCRSVFKVGLNWKTGWMPVQKHANYKQTNLIEAVRRAGIYCFQAAGRQVVQKECTCQMVGKRG